MKNIRLTEERFLQLIKNKIKIKIESSGYFYVQEDHNRKLKPFYSMYINGDKENEFEFIEFPVSYSSMSTIKTYIEKLFDIECGYKLNTYFWFNYCEVRLIKIDHHTLTKSFIPRKDILIDMDELKEYMTNNDNTFRFTVLGTINTKIGSLTTSIHRFILDRKEMLFVTTDEIANIDLTCIPKNMVLANIDFLANKDKHVWFIIDRSSIIPLKERGHNIIDMNIFLPYMKIIDIPIEKYDYELIKSFKGLSKLNIESLIDTSYKIVKNMDDFNTAKNELIESGYPNKLDCFVEWFTNPDITQAELSNKYNISQTLVSRMIRMQDKKLNEVARYIRMERKRPLNYREMSVVAVYNSLLEGMSEEECMKKYRLTPNITRMIKNRDVYYKHIIDYAEDNNIIINNLPDIEVSEDLNNIIFMCMRNELLNAVYGDKTKSGRTIPYIIIVNIIKDYYENMMSVEELRKKYRLGENTIRAYINFKGKYTQTIMSHIPLNRKRPLSKKEEKIVEVYNSIKRLGFEKTAIKYKTSIEVLKAINERKGRSRNILDYAEKNKLLK